MQPQQKEQHRTLSARPEQASNDLGSTKVQADRASKVDARGTSSTDMHPSNDVAANTNLSAFALWRRGKHVSTGDTTTSGRHAKKASSDQRCHDARETVTAALWDDFMSVAHSVD